MQHQTPPGARVEIVGVDLAYTFDHERARANEHAPPTANVEARPLRDIDGSKAVDSRLVFRTLDSRNFTRPDHARHSNRPAGCREPGAGASGRRSSGDRDRPADEAESLPLRHTHHAAVYRDTAGR